MRPMAKAIARTKAQDVSHSPLACALLTGVLAASFWIGMVVLAQHIVG